MGKFITGTHREISPLREIPNPTEKRLVKRLGLEFAYDHANPSMGADILIYKVLQRYRFNDMLQVAYYFGLDTLKLKAYEIYGEDQPRRIKQILRNIETGFEKSHLEHEVVF